MPDTTPELWTTQEAAAYLEIQEGSARGLLSRRGVRRVDTIRHPVSGRDTARFRADEVRALAKDRKPGRRTSKTLT